MTEPTPVQPTTAGEEVVRTASVADARAFLRAQGVEVGSRGRLSAEQISFFEENTGQVVVRTTA